MIRLSRLNRALPWLLTTVFLAVVLLLTGRLAPTLHAGGSEEATRKADADRDLQAASDLDRLSEALSAIVDRVKPSVVHVQAIRSREALAQELHQLFADRDFQLPPVAGTGSGVIVDPNGFIVTNNHVVDLADVVRVTLADGRKYRADVTGVDRMTDLAILKISAGRLPAANLGDSDDVKVGNLVLAIGSPFRLTHSVSHGIVSALGRTDVQVDIDYQNWIQTDAPINPGNSGGPLINTRGEVIGISVAIATDSGGHQGVGFAIPSNTVSHVAGFLTKGERIVRGYLGVSIRPVEPKFADAYGLDEPSGAFVDGVMAGSPAEQGGLMEEDIILAVSGKPVGTRQQLQDVIARMAPGSSIETTIWRNGNRMTLKMIVSGQPEGFSTASSQRDLDGGGNEPGEKADENAVEAVTTLDEDGDRIEFPQVGLTVMTLPSKRSTRAGDQVEGRVIVRGVETTGEAYLAGLAKGQIIVTANGKPVHEVAQLREVLTDEALFKGVRLKVRQGKDTSYTVLQIR